MPIGLEFNFSCVNCGETNTDVRNLDGFPCEKCLPEVHENFVDVMEKLGTLKKYQEILQFKKEYEAFQISFVKRLDRIQPAFNVYGLEGYFCQKVSQ